MTEAIQTVMRRYAIPNAYEQMRDLTRGQHISKTRLQAFIKTLTIPDDAKKALLE